MQSFTMAAAANHVDDNCDQDLELAAAHLRFVDNRISDQLDEDIPI
jgi:hypothetical protein